MPVHDVAGQVAGGDDVASSCQHVELPPDKPSPLRGERECNVGKPQPRVVWIALVHRLHARSVGIDEGGVEPHCPLDSRQYRFVVGDRVVYTKRVRVNRPIPDNRPVVLRPESDRILLLHNLRHEIFCLVAPLRTIEYLTRDVQSHRMVGPGIVNVL